MRIILSGMHRSGLNVIGRWLLRQSALQNRELTIHHSDWVFGNIQDFTAYSFVSQINHPEHRDVFKKFIYKNSVLSIERESFCEFESLVYKYDFLDWHQIVIVRDFRNWAASYIKMQEKENIPRICIHEIDIRKYEGYLSYAETGKGCGERKFCPYVISYNKWCVDKNYRKQICTDLGLQFTDCGFDRVPVNGGGSSFDGMDYKGHGSDMNTLERWKEMKDRQDYNFVLMTYATLVRRSDEYFEVLNEGDG